ncbi:dusp29 [Symbiodinium natans]|uniref:Dusp29 protein n=1 Tax=Symbiodinium natans TaxID=878477 RepID=A0A812S894_9DINO|nr:dusp29 [Symbiodinium natans]
MYVTFYVYDVLAGVFYARISAKLVDLHRYCLRIKLQILCLTESHFWQLPPPELIKFSAVTATWLKNQTSSWQPVILTERCGQTLTVKRRSLPAVAAPGNAQVPLFFAEVLHALNFLFSSGVKRARPVSAPHLPRASLVEEEGAGVWSRLGNICRPSSAPHLLRASLVQKEGALRAPVEEKEEESEEEVQDRPEEQAEEVIDAEAAASTQEEQEEGEDWRAGAAANWQWQWQDGTETVADLRTRFTMSDLLVLNCQAYEEEKKLLEPLGVRVVPANPNYLAQRQNLWQNFIRELTLEPHRQVWVHCNVGRVRGPALTIAVALLQNHDLWADDLIREMRQKRPVIDLHGRGFMKTFRWIERNRWWLYTSARQACGGDCSKKPRDSFEETVANFERLSVAAAELMNKLVALLHAPSRQP